MNKNSYSRAKKLTLIPIRFFVFTIICLVLATLLEGPTNRGTIYTIIIFLGLMSMIFSPLPCMVMSIVGTVFASKAMKEGTEGAKKFLILGIAEILLCVLGVIIVILMIKGGMSV